MWEFNNDKPVYVQIVDEILNRIASGVYKSGERIPSVRELAEEARVNPNTMQRALAEVERAGYIVSLRTSGKFVTDNTGLINSLSKDRAKDVVVRFIQDMQRMGFTLEESIELIKRYCDEVDGQSQ